jgi:hypothetical protein
MTIVSSVPDCGVHRGGQDTQLMQQAHQDHLFPGFSDLSIVDTEDFGMPAG